MKTRYVIAAVLIFISGLAITACNVDREQKVEDAQENVDQANLELKTAEAEYEKEWQEFKTSAEMKIDANEKKILEYKSEILTASTRFKIKYQKEVMILEQKNADLRKKISEYKYEGKDKWEEFKVGFNRDVDAVALSIKGIFESKE